MTSASDHRKSVMQSLHILRQLAARQGDPEAVKALRDIGLKAASILRNLTIYPDTDETPAVFRDGVAVAKQVAGESAEWPATYHAISEIRKKVQSQTDNLGVGSSLSMRIVGTARGFNYNSQTGFAYDLFNRIEEVRLNPDDHFHITKNHPELVEDGILTESQMRFTWQNLAAMLPLLSLDSLDLWVAACIELCREDCEGIWEDFPWSECVISRLITNKKKALEEQKGADGSGNEKSTKIAVNEKISEGLKSLILKARPEKRRSSARG